jgi:hypothetical protein
VTRLNILSRVKSRQEGKNKEIEIYMQETENAFKQNEDTSDDCDHTIKEQPLTQYDETIYSNNTTTKTSSKTVREEPKLRKTWENPSTIEHHIDSLEHSNNQNSNGTGEIEDKVDRLLAKKKKL